MSDWFEFPRNDLLYTLDVVRVGLSHEGTTDQRNSFVFQGGKVYTFNGELFCAATSGLPPAFTASVKSKPLFDLLRKSGDTDIAIDLANEQELSIRLNDSEEIGIVRDNTITLPISKIEKPKQWKQLPPKLIEGMVTVSPCAKKPNANDVITTSLHIHPQWVECFDNQQGCRYSVQTGVTESLLIRADGVSKMLPWEFSQFALTDNWFHLRNNWGFTLAKNLLYSREPYPELTSAYGNVGVAVSLSKVLLSAIDKAEVFASENKDHNVVYIDLNKDKVKIEAQGLSGWYRKTKKTKYDGPAIRFAVTTKILSEIVEKYDQCFVSDNCLLVQGQGWRYITAIESSKLEPKGKK